MLSLPPPRESGGRVLAIALLVDPVLVGVPQLPVGSTIPHLLPLPVLFLHHLPGTVDALVVDLLPALEGLLIAGIQLLPLVQSPSVSFLSLLGCFQTLVRNLGKSGRNRRKNTQYRDTDEQKY